MSRITVNMLSSADKVEGQGVGSAYKEQVALVKEGAKDFFDVRINDSKDADILHVHTVDPKNYFRMKRSKGVKVCYVHFLPDTLDGSIKIPKLFFNTFKKYVIRFYNTADYLVVVNPIFMEELARFGISKDKMVYIPNYVSKEEFYKKDENEILAIRKKYGVDEKAFVVLGVGQVQTRKGVLDFVEVAKQMPHLSFVWAGGFSFGKITDGYEELKKIVDNPPANVKFLGIVPRSEMNDIFNMSNVLFMPSFNELFPMAILEAVNLEKPLLLRNLELYKDILFEKYMSGNSVEEFKKLLTELYSDTEIYEKYAKFAYDINQYYSKENVLKIWIDFYTGIVNGNFR